MSSQVLARKWRPTNFTEVVGQQSTLQALSNALNEQRLHHAYLLTGTRGIGKTTIARILAKSLNCEAKISATPCETCSACQAMNTGNFIDLIEVDAASRTKVDDTRDLLNNVQYMPTRGRYKIYIIDEVHMLSTHSFNALLKTLEEPPPHVIFILATTDPQRLPVTVLSRCLQFHLKNLSPELIKKHLEYVLKKENTPFEAIALEHLALAADGSMRDALSLLDQAIAYGNNHVKLTDVQAMLGSPDDSYTQALITALAEQNASSLLETIATLAENGVAFSHVLDALLMALHQLTILRIAPDAASAMHADTLQPLVDKLSPEDIQLFYQIALMGQRDLPLAPTPRIGFEMTLLRMLAFQPTSGAPLEPPKKKQISPLAVKPAEITKSSSPVKSPEITKPPSPVKPPEITAPLKDISDLDWHTTYDKLKLSGIARIIASHCMLLENKDNLITLQLDKAQAPLLDKTQEKRIQEALSSYLGKSVTITITEGNTETDCPANLNKRKAAKQLQEAHQSIEKDSKIKAIISKFDATIDTNSVQTTEEVMI